MGLRMSLPGELHDAIQDLMRKHSEDDEPWSLGILSRWVLVAETVGTDGLQYLHQIYPSGTQGWTRLGLLHGALGAIAADRIAGEIDLSED